MAEAPNEANDFLSVQTKADSAEKLEAIIGKPRYNYLFAAELNKIVKSINLLRTLVPTSNYIVEQIIATGISIYFTDLGSDFIALINASDDIFQIGTEGTTFIVVQNDGVKVIYVFIGTPGAYGSQNHANADDFILLYNAASLTVEKPYKTVKAVLTLNDGAWVPFTLLQEEFQYIQIWGPPDNFVIKYFPELSGDPQPFPQGTHVLHSNTLRDGIVKTYGYKMLTVGFNAGIAFKCDSYNADALPSEMSIEINIPTAEQGEPGEPV